MLTSYIVEPYIRELAENGFEISIQSSSSPIQMTNPHVHNALEFIYILDGNFKIYANDMKFMLSQGDLCFFRSNTVHHTYSVDSFGGKYFVIKIEPSVILSLANEKFGISYMLQFMLQTENSKVVWKSNELYDSKIQRAVENTLNEHLSGDFGKDIAMKIYASKLVLEVLRYENTNTGIIDAFSYDSTITKQIYETMLYINANYMNDITALECANKLNMSYSYFSRTFKRITGKSFKEYLNETRINQAEKLMFSTDRTITDICESCGYNSVSYFIAQYKTSKRTNSIQIQKRSVIQIAVKALS